MAGLEAAGSQLDGAFSVLRGRWVQTRAVWTDPVGQEFERELWVPLDAMSRSTQQTVDLLAEVVAQAKRNVK